MTHLSSSSCGTASLQPPRPPKPPVPPRGQRSITTCRKSALVVENDASLMRYFLRVFREKGFAVRTASDADEALRLYRECGPFSAVLIDYCLSPKPQVFIDHAGQTNGVQIAMAIRHINPSQRMLIAAFDYSTEQEVVRPQELKDAQLLIDLCNFRLHGLIERIEIDRAIEELTPADLQRLRWSAGFRIRGLGRAACGRTGSDLLAEALQSTLEGTRRSGEGRRWNKDVDFVTHLMGAMRSISSCWKRKFDGVFLESEVLVCDIDGHKTSPLDNIPSNEPTPDDRLIEMQDENRIIGMFVNDSHAIWVLRGLFGGLKKSEITQKYGLLEKQYTGAVKRIRLKLLGRGKA
jgi:CheY-like chemotaxis protein